MKPLFLEELEIRTNMPLAALDKITAAGICMYSVEKCGAGRLKILVKSKESKKIFAIFRSSCYTVTRKKSAGLKYITEKLLARPGAVIGALLFLLICAAGNFFVLRIDVQGSAARYADEAKQILADNRVGMYSVYDEEAAERARAAMMQLPNVVFASVEKSGCTVTVTLEESAETPVPERETSLISPCAGVVEEIAVLRGTALVSEGDTVAAGQELAGGWLETQDGEKVPTFAVARASILCTGDFSYTAAEESEEQHQRALAAAYLACGGEPVSETVDVIGQGEQVIYTVHLSYRVRIAVNMG